MDKVRLFVIGGPGNPKKRFIEKLKNISNYEKDLKLRALIERNANKFISF